MSFRLLRRLCVLVGVAAALAGAAAIGAEPTGLVKVTLHPQAVPVPSLKYRLLPDRLSQRRGNAAVYYGKVTAEENRFFGDAKLVEQIDDWRRSPLADLRGGKVNFPVLYPIEDSLRRGALCTECDWQLPIGEVPFHQILLPDAQQSRAFGRILALRARIQIADQQYEAAVTTLQTGYALGRNVATGETIVNGLVGVAICGMMNDQVVDYVQQVGSPNLYWALTDLPAPIIDMHRSLEVARMTIELSFPEIAQARTATKTAEEWEADFIRIFAHEVLTDVRDANPPKGLSKEDIEKRCDDRLPAAKKYLIASGIPEKEVAAMPKFQVATLYSLALCHENIDEAIRYYRLPNPEAIAKIRAVEKRLRNDDQEIVPISWQLFPAVEVSREQPVRLERMTVVLRVFEALRMYAAGHDGKLPDALASVTEAPIPNDPVAGKPFEYKRMGEKAVLRGPEFLSQSLDYEITMVED